MKTLREYQEMNKKVGTFGVKYLDDRLRGILLGDLILIGARSGAGKSTIANYIATVNKNNGINVALFSLENFEGDMFIEKAYYKYKELTKEYHVNLRDFASNSVDLQIDALNQAEQYALECLKGINIIHRQKDFGIQQLQDEIIRHATNGSKIIIIDHLDYIDNFNDTENKHISELMKTIRQVQNEFKVAVVAISHLRKSGNSKDAPIIPSMDEFYGSGNKVKESTAVIMFAPDDECNMDSQSHLKSTWCCIRKLRLGGIDNKAAKMYFNTDTGCYNNSYDLFKVNYSGTKTEEILSNYAVFGGKYD